jgi:serine/threonine protein kinase
MAASKAKKLASFLKKEMEDPPPIIAPVVVLVNPIEPELTGKSAAFTVIDSALIARLSTDPRTEGQKAAAGPQDPGQAGLVWELLVDSSRPMRPRSTLGHYKLEEQIAISDSTETWRASPLAEPAINYRLKQHHLDPLLVGDERSRQAALVKRDMDALVSLKELDGVVPLVGNAFEVDNAFVVVTGWPTGRVLESVLQERIEADEAQSMVLALIKSLAAIHKKGIVHRNLSPSCLYISDGVLIADFDYSRLPGRESITSLFAADAFDPNYAAPEVSADPSAATQASDVYSAARIALRILRATGRNVDDPWSLLPEAWSRGLSAALSEDPSHRPADADILLGQMSGQEPLTVDRLQIHDTINSRYAVMQSANTTGGTAYVHQVFDTLVNKYFAAKFIRPDLAKHMDVKDEYQRLASLQHPSIVRVETILQTEYVRRGEEMHPFPSLCLLTDWVVGTPLSDYIDTGMPPARVIQIGIEIAEALTEVHNAQVVHRDVKPENIIVDQEQRPILIDFNIASPIAAVSKTSIGTMFYQPPDIKTSGWSYDADTYGLGVSLAELLACRRLKGAVQTWLSDSWPFGDDFTSLREVLREATAENAAERLSADDLAAGLRRAALELVRVGRRGRPAPPTYQRRDANHNPYLDRLLELFSQSTKTNSGTRGLDDFRRWLYLDTRIDHELRPAVLRGDLKLVVITGNAGDGKTAFIRMVENDLADGRAAVVPREGGNGSTIEHDGLILLTNWDGSQDEGEDANDAVLASFFSPFSGSDPDPPDGITHLIAINEGRLIDFLNGRRDEFPWLERSLLDILDGAEPDAEWLALVNLNLRSLTAAGDRGSIVGDLLDRIADEALWADCDSCVAADHCPARANAATLRDPVLGPRTSERVRQLLDVVRLRRRLHITMRDLCSVLAYAVTANRDCREVIELTDTQAMQDLLGGHIYNSVFGSSDAAIREVRGAQHDRLLTELGALDVINRPEPEEDGRLWALGPSALPLEPDGLSRSDRPLMEALWRAATEASGEGGSWSGLRFAHASLRRKFFFEREDPAYLDMLPYEHLRSFLALLAGSAGGLRSEDERKIAEAISRSEGLRSEEAVGHLAVRVVQDLTAVDRSFITRPATDFRLDIVDRSAAARYIEYQPDLVRFSSRHEDALRLDIDVDLWEALQRIWAGFTPSREDLRGAWLNLQTFKETVASIPSRNLLLQPRGGRTVEVTIDASGRIVAGAI